ncbi:MAG TPA: hypothetical protein VL024_10535, partial [Castellaniella sp.]|nr:hypothetical protein [Castellaniella sp.]
MHIVLPGALPDSGVAPELANRLPDHAPTLARWLQQTRAAALPSHAVDTHCTPLEHWLLHASGFQPAQAQHLSAGLGPLRAPDLADDDPVWLAELIHMAPSRDGAALLGAGSLAIAEPQAQALFDAAHEDFQALDMPIEYGPGGVWRVRWPASFALPCASP